MATLAQIHTIRFGSTGLLPRVEAACLLAAWSTIKDQLADKVSIEKVWAELQYKPGSAA